MRVLLPHHETMPEAHDRMAADPDCDLVQPGWRERYLRNRGRHDEADAEARRNPQPDTWDGKTWLAFVYFIVVPLWVFLVLAVAYALSPDPMQPYLSFGYGVPLAELTPDQRAHVLSDTFRARIQSSDPQILHIEGFCEGAFSEWPEANALTFSPPLDRYRHTLGRAFPMFHAGKGIDVSVLADFPDLISTEEDALKNELLIAGSTIDPSSFRWIVFTVEY